MYGCCEDLNSRQTTIESRRRTLDENEYSTYTGTVGSVFSRRNAPYLASNQNVASQRNCSPEDHLRSDLGDQRLVQVESHLSKQNCRYGHGITGRTTRTNSSLDHLLGAPCQCGSSAICSHPGNDRDRSCCPLDSWT